jgi:dTMP kinase
VINRHVLLIYVNNSRHTSPALGFPHLHVHRPAAYNQAFPPLNRSTPNAMFLSIDGCDGTGKSTQMERLCAWLRSQGHDVVTCRDPGSTPLGEAIRGLLLDRHDLKIDRRSEMLLYMAARAQLVDEVIRPALSAGKTVVCDRFLLANVVYQGHAGGLDVRTLWDVGRVATAGVVPRLTFLLDMPADAAATRLNRELDRMERQGDAFHARVRQGFLDEAAGRPDEIIVIDASRSVDEVATDIRAVVGQLLEKRKAESGKPRANRLSPPSG